MQMTDQVEANHPVEQSLLKVRWQLACDIQCRGEVRFPVTGCVGDLPSHPTCGKQSLPIKAYRGFTDDRCHRWAEDQGRRVIL
jgi:hypothetical protein